MQDNPAGGNAARDGNIIEQDIQRELKDSYLTYLTNVFRLVLSSSIIVLIKLPCVSCSRTDTVQSARQTNTEFEVNHAHQCNSNAIGPAAECTIRADVVSQD